MLKKITKSMIEGINTLEKMELLLLFMQPILFLGKEKITLWEKIKSYLGVY